MSITVGDVVNSARLTLIDAAKATWPDAELVTYLNEAVQKTCFVKPDAYITLGSIALVAGVVQSLPASAVALMDISRNTVSQLAVTLVDRALLETADPTWGVATPGVDIEHYVVDPRSPRTFSVYPPATSESAVIALVAQRPPALVNLTDTILMTETYVPVLIDYTLARAYEKNSKKQDLTKASFYMQSWGAALGLESQAVVLAEPKIADGTST